MINMGCLMDSQSLFLGMNNYDYLSGKTQHFQKIHSAGNRENKQCFGFAGKMSENITQGRDSIGRVVALFLITQPLSLRTSESCRSSSD